MEVKGLQVNPSSDRVSAEGEAIQGGPMQFRMLRFFMHNRERVFKRSQLLDTVCGSSVYVEEGTAGVHIRRLRKAPAPFDYGKPVQTVRGTDHRFSTLTGS